MMKTYREKNLLFAVLTGALICILIGGLIFFYQRASHKEKDQILVGLICDGDEATPYSANFSQALERVREEEGERVKVDIREDVAVEDGKRVCEELVEEGCDLIITNSFGFGEASKAMAGENPTVQFVQATQSNAGVDPVFPNYHTFMGHIYEGRYIAGQVAGRKLTKLISEKKIDADEALVGYVGAYPYPEVISGFTAFYLGVRDQCPSARMRVRYTGSWMSYQKEYETAKALIDEGCVIISQHSDTTGPAVACEEAGDEKVVFHVGYNQDMSDVAPTTSLISTRMDWYPYLSSAVKAVLSGRPIEDLVDGEIHGTDAGAGFDKGWVRMLPVNETTVPQGTEDLVEESVEAFKKGEVHVFKGDYKGVDPEDPGDIIDLKTEYKENEKGSAPSFHWILDGIKVEG